LIGPLEFRVRRSFGAAWQAKADAGKMKQKTDEKLVLKVLVSTFIEVSSLLKVEKVHF